MKTAGRDPHAPPVPHSRAGRAGNNASAPAYQFDHRPPPAHRASNERPALATAAEPVGPSLPVIQTRGRGPWLQKTPNTDYGSQLQRPRAQRAMPRKTVSGGLRRRLNRYMSNGSKSCGYDTLAPRPPRPWICSHLDGTDLTRGAEALRHPVPRQTSTIWARRHRTIAYQIN